MVKSGVMSLSGFIWPSGFMRLKVGKIKVRKSGLSGKSKENVAKSGKKW